MSNLIIFKKKGIDKIDDMKSFDFPVNRTTTTLIFRFFININMSF